ncbi:hypothetical protein XENOCAPTIV_000352 [Xenoophorus captivus]|uniref:DUF4704 domain-containing protein n=1 Tax=Xenoophorus captivus TaxID=1517983 RepID=A0ABV0Q443_9TELE
MEGVLATAPLPPRRRTFPRLSPPARHQSLPSHPTLLPSSAPSPSQHPLQEAGGGLRQTPRHDLKLHQHMFASTCFMTFNSSCTGPNQVPLFKADGELSELNSKLLLYYTPQDVVNVVGGIGVLLPLLEQVCEAEQVYNGGQETSDLLGPELTSPRGPAAMLLPLNKSAEGRLERNSIAAFLLMVKNLIRHHPVNQESLLQCHGPSIIGAMLSKVPGTMMDMNVLMACQLLLEQVFNEGNSLLLQQLYQHLLFNFRIWTRSHFAVCLGKAAAVPSFLRSKSPLKRCLYANAVCIDTAGMKGVRVTKWWMLNPLNCRV